VVAAWPCETSEACGAVTRTGSLTASPTGDPADCAARAVLAVAGSAAVAAGGETSAAACPATTGGDPAAGTITACTASAWEVVSTVATSSGCDETGRAGSRLSGST
jgi:hypothetical protein